jgi:flavin reductase (DIM6/NTAB) family NADH-FMN oxidoreductase RutF
MHTTSSTDPEARAAFLKAMTMTASTVSIVTTAGPAGRYGATVSAMSSVSADGERPTLLVCMNEKVSASPAIIENGQFCVNVLRDDQAAVSDGFARRSALPNDDKFSCTTWSGGQHGQPIIEGALVSFECRLLTRQQVGTHHIFVGEVLHIQAACGGSPLIYSNRAYATTARLPEAAV